MADSRPRSLRSFALSLNIDPSLFSKILKGERPANQQIIDALVKKYNASEKWLLTGDGDMYMTPKERAHHAQDSNGVPDQNAEYIEFLKSNDAFFKNQYSTFNQQVLANLTALHNQGKSLEALIKITLEHMGNVEAHLLAVPPEEIHDKINTEILTAAVRGKDNGVGSPGKG